MWASFASCVAGGTISGTTLGTGGIAMANEAKFDAEDFDFQNALPTGNKFIMNSSSTGPPVVQGGVINLLNVSPDGNTVTLLNSVLATAI
jgi:hypothetical protein